MRIIAILACLSLFSLAYVQRIHPDERVLITHRAAIMEGEGLTPLRYRVLTPAILTLFMQGNDFQGAYTLFHALLFPALYAALYTWLRMWGSETGALLGCALLTVMLPIMLENYSAWAGVEVFLLALGLIAIVRQMPAVSWWAVGIIVLAALNRETAILLPLAYGAINAKQILSRQYAGTALLYFGAWALIFVGLRVWLGSGDPQLTIRQIWMNNTQTWRAAQAVKNLVLFAPLGGVIIARWHNAPFTVQRVASLAGFYVCALGVFGQWYEVRLLMPLTVLVGPLMSYEIEDTI